MQSQQPMPAIIASRALDIQPSWKSELSQCISSVSELLHCLQLNPEQLSVSQRATEDFPLKVPRPFIERMEVGNPNDPLLRQVLPVTQETEPAVGYSPDPLDEIQHNPIPGVVHKYDNRLLLIVSPNCAINCRYCFRRHFPHQENRQSKQQWQQALTYIRLHKEINEVIFSGGDPLAANDNFLGWLTEQIANIPHVKRLRIHTRLPVVIPSRIDDAFLGWATGTRLLPIVVLHINHANEIDTAVQQMVQRLLGEGMLVLNQTVLLKSINDRSAILAELSEALYDTGVIPYYLHLLDPVAGASHFDIAGQQATQIYGQLQKQLPGFLVPKLVREIPGEKSKTLMAQNSNQSDISG
jgi:EF-P beta-lysylation protein EpmB